MKIILLHLPNNNLRLVERIHPNLLFILTLEPFTPVPKIRQLDCIKFTYFMNQDIQTYGSLSPLSDIKKLFDHPCSFVFDLSEGR